MDIKGPGISKYIPVLTVCILFDASLFQMYRLEKEFEIVSKLGEGELSVVYQIRNKENQKESAIKVIALPQR